jgi:phosphoribosylformylglycinamidine synthase
VPCASANVAPLRWLALPPADGQLTVTDDHFGNKPVDMPMEVLLGKAPKCTRDARRNKISCHRFDVAEIDLAEAALRVLRLPAVASQDLPDNHRRPQRRRHDRA